MKKKTKILIAGIAVGVIAVAAVGIEQHVTADQEGAAIAIIGGADGPTSIFLAGKLTGGENQVAEYTSITMEDALVRKAVQMEASPLKIILMPGIMIWV